MKLSNVVSRSKKRGASAAFLLIPAIIVLAVLSFQSRRVQSAPVPVVTFEGYHDTADCGSITGWAWDKTQPNTPINVDIFGDNVLIATVPADQFRQDLFNAGKGNGFHAFSLATPLSFKNGQAHVIRVQIASSNIGLGGTPRTINCFEFEGYHDFADCNVIGGWAWDSTQPNTPINVDVYIDSDNFASIRAPANQFRQDLLNVGKGNGQHAFNFPPPSFLKDNQPHSIRVKIAGTSIELGGTPRTITCSANPPPAYEGFHDGADCNVIFGWAWDSTHPNTPISVDIYSGNNLIATILANQFRQDLVNAGKGDGNHAFSLNTPMILKDNKPHTISIGFHGTDIALSNSFRTITCP